MEILEDNGFEANVEPTAGRDGSVAEILNLECFRLALELWTRCLKEPAENLLKSYETRINNLSNKMLDPDKYAIIWYSKRILKLSSDWVLYHKKHVFKNCSIELISNTCVPKLIWRPDGSIDGLKTIEALLNPPIFSVEHQYRLACLYCMEERIVEQWPQLTGDENVTSDVFTVQDLSLFSYWNSRMSGCVFEDGMKSMENRLVSNKVIDNLSAAVYFFDRLEGDERVEKGCQIISFVKLDERAEYVATMISKFNEDECRRAFQVHCSSIIYPLIMNRVYSKYALELWNRMRNTLTIQSFMSTMTRITGTIRAAFKDPDARFLDEPDEYDDFKRRIFTVIADLWKITPNGLRRHEVLSVSHGVIYTLVAYFVAMNIDNDPEGRLISTVLADADTRLCRKVLIKVANELMDICSPRAIYDLVNVLSKTDGKKFRETVLFHNEKRMLNFFREKRFAEVDEFLELFEPEPFGRYNHKCMIVSEIRDPTDYFSYPYELTDEQVKQLRTFLRKGFECDPHSEAKFKQKFYQYYPRLWMKPCEAYRNMADYAMLL